MDSREMAFLKYPELAEHIERMAASGNTGNFNQWNNFLFAINKVLIDLNSRESHLLAENKRLSEMADALLAHCPNSECGECAKIVCPHGEIYHFHHDGCPACDGGENNDP